MRYLLATVLAVVMAGQATADDFIVIVFDSSGSMGERMRSVKGQPTRLEVAQNALIEVVSSVPDSTRIGILTFEGWAYDLQKVNRAVMAKAVKNVGPGGGTPLYEYIRAGATRLLKERERQLNKGTYRLVIVTDGAAGDEYLNEDSTYRDGSTKLGVMNDIARRRIGVDAIGLDLPGNHAISNIISSKNLGTYMQGNDPKSLTQSLKQAVAEVSLKGQDTGEDAFKELDQLPDEFFVVAIKGLTTNQNHPIGEKPPIVEVNAETGVVTTHPDPANEDVPELGEAGPFPFKVLGILGGVVAIIVVVTVMRSSRR